MRGMVVGALFAVMEACEDGLAISCWELGMTLKKGLGMPKDPAKAKALLARA